MSIRAWLRKLGGCEEADTLLEALRDCFRTVETLGRLDPDDEVIAEVRARVDEYLGR
jgi:hypothetical protein